MYHNGSQLFPASGLDETLRPNISNGASFKAANPVYLGSTFNNGHTTDAHLAEMLIFYDDLSLEDVNAIESYLSKKWNLTDSVDSDADGFTDADEMSLGTNPADPSSNPLPDLSDTVDSEIGTASGLDSVEGNLALWLDASNINYKQNAGIDDGDAITEWKDLSGNGYDLTQTSSGYAPVFSIESNQHYVDFVSNDFLKTNLSAGFTALNGDSRTVIVLLKQEKRLLIIFTLARVTYQLVSMAIQHVDLPCQ